jgi:hypothetical protein
MQSSLWLAVVVARLKDGLAKKGPLPNQLRNG